MCKQIVKFTYPCTHYTPPHHHQTSCLSVTPVSCDCHDLVTFDLIKSLDGWKKINYSIKIININIHNNICKSHPLSYDEGKREQAHIYYPHSHISWQCNVMVRRFYLRHQIAQQVEHLTRFRGSGFKSWSGPSFFLPSNYIWCLDQLLKLTG